MPYGKDLLTAAVEKAGSRYALSKATGLAESELSRVWNGQRDVPASWVLPLARVAEVDPTEALENWDLERAEKKRLRQQLSRSAVGGVVATLLTFASSVGGWDRPSHAANVHQPIDVVAHRIYRGLQRVLRSMRPWLIVPCGSLTAAS